MIREIVEALRAIGPSFVLKRQWIKNEGRISNTLTRFLWEYRAVSTPFNELRRNTYWYGFQMPRLRLLQNFWRNWAPDIPVPTIEYLKTVPALTTRKQDLPEAIPLALIMIWEASEEKTRDKMIPLMRRVNSAVNFDLELSKRKKVTKII